MQLGRDLCHKLFKHIIIRSVAVLSDNHHSLSSPAKEQWLSIRQTCTAFRDILAQCPQENPFRKFAVTFRIGNTAFNSVMCQLANWEQLMDSLLHTGFLKISLEIVFTKGNGYETHQLVSVFDVLQCSLHVAVACNKLQVELACTHWSGVHFPNHLNLKEVHLKLTDYNARGRTISSTFIVNCPDLQYLSIMSNSSSAVHIVHSQGLKNLCLDFSSMPFMSAASGNIAEILWAKDSTMFGQFSKTSEQLTTLELTINAAGFRGIQELFFPNLESLSLRVVGFYTSSIFPSIRLIMPKLQNAQFQLCNTRCLSFIESTFSSSLKRLIIMTPCIQVPMFHDAEFALGSGHARMNPDCLINLPLLEEAVIAAHGMEPVHNLSQKIQWNRVRKLTIVLGIGIADLVARIELPSLEVVQIVFPAWMNDKRSRSNIQHYAREDLSGSDSDDSEGTGGSGRLSRYVHSLGIHSCLSEERDKLSSRVPGVKIRKVKNYKGLDRNNFDILRSLTFW